MSHTDPNTNYLFSQFYASLSWPLVVTSEREVVFQNKKAADVFPAFSLDEEGHSTTGWSGTPLQLNAQHFTVWQWTAPFQAGDMAEEFSLLNNLFQKNSDSLKLIDTKGYVLQMNEPAFHALPKSLENNWRETLWPLWWEKTHQQRAQEAVDSISAGKITRFQVQKTLTDGSLTDWDVTVVPIKTSPTTYEKGLVHSKDVTALLRKERELQMSLAALEKQAAEFRFVTDFMPQLVWATKPDGYHDFFNQRWYDYTGLTYEQTKADGWNAVLHPDDQERAWQVWSHSLRTGDPYRIEYRFRRNDGEYRWFLGLAMPMRDENGTIVKWFGTCTDIEEAKNEQHMLENLVAERTKDIARALEQVKSSNADLKQINEDLTQFAYIASHDLQEPLRKVQMFGDLAAAKLGNNNPEVKRHLQTMMSGAGRMSNLIKDLLRYSKISGAEKKFEQVDLNRVMDSVREDYDLLIAEKKASVQVSALPVVSGIPVQLSQLFSNLLNNALKFAEDNQPIVRIEANVITSGQLNEQVADKFGGQDRFHRITFCDNGPGVPEEYRERIFAVFQRLQPDKTAGTGMGLAICRKIMENHRGWISMLPVETGCCFEILLPA